MAKPSQLQMASPLQKERDLELAARIGQSLLKHNQSLTERNELLEEQLDVAKEEVKGKRVTLSLLPSPSHVPAPSRRKEQLSLFSLDYHATYLCRALSLGLIPSRLFGGGLGPR